MRGHDPSATFAAMGDDAVVADGTTPAARSLSERLVTSPSWPGALLVLALALALILGLPALAATMHGGGYPAGEPFEAAPGLQITADEGWEYDDSSGLFYTLTRAGATLVLVPAVATDQPLDEALQVSTDALASASYVVTDAQEFTTDAGDRGMVVSGHTDTNASATWIIERDGGQATFLLTGPDSTFAETFESADAVVRSAVILEVTS